MPEVGVRELKARASEIVRDMRENKTSYTITYRGKPVGVLSPVEEPSEQAATQPDGWDEMLRIMDEMRDGWESEKTLNEILSEMRR